ncbi:hypothetical protein CVO77_14815 [Sphingopyxis lindanitolerans]|uniref:Uncharacterized protein n=1 Tax=Sphingopyxis lindanitolerans TaxID=2054227 RepID=A0A2S8B239_9SPHN|nr:hypothetical protein CVO77_14815 [Sphingopyxis lindanitolerans]
MVPIAYKSFGLNFPCSADVFAGREAPQCLQKAHLKRGKIDALDGEVTPFDRFTGRLGTVFLQENVTWSAFGSAA